MLEKLLFKRSVAIFSISFFIVFLFFFLLILLMCNKAIFVSFLYGFIVSFVSSLIFLLCFRNHNNANSVLKSFYFSIFMKTCSMCVLLLLFLKIGIYSPLCFFISLFIVQVSFWFGFFVLMRM